MGDEETPRRRPPNGPDDVYCDADTLLADEMVASISGASPRQQAEILRTLLVAKLAAVVEIAVELNGGEPIVVRSDRLEEIVRTNVCVSELPTGEGWRVAIAEPAEVERVLRESDHRASLRRLGSRRN